MTQFHNMVRVFASKIGTFPDWSNNLHALIIYRKTHFQELLQRHRSEVRLIKCSLQNNTDERSLKHNVINCSKLELIHEPPKLCIYTSLLPRQLTFIPLELYCILDVELNEY